MSSKHLKELLRQRALLQSQMDRLDREIAETGNPDTALKSAPNTSPSRPETIPPEFLQLEPDPIGAARKAKRGCLIYSSILILIFALICFLIYFWGYRDHPVKSAPAEATAAMPVTRSA